MELSKAERDSIFLDLLINTFMINPQLYDKSEGTYIYTAEKIQILKKLSDYLKNEFKITKSVSEIVSAWQKLVAQFKKADENLASGSAAANNEFPYYKDLLFLKPALKHKNCLSRMLPPTSSSITMPTAQQSHSTFVNASPSAQPSSSINVNASSDVFGSNLYMPHALHLPPGGQYPYWPMMPPYAFGPSIPSPYMPFTSFHPTTSSVPYQHMSPGSTNNTISSVNSAPLAFISTYSCDVATSSTKENRMVPKPAESSSKRVPEYDSFAKKN